MSDGREKVRWVVNPRNRRAEMRSGSIRLDRLPGLGEGIGEGRRIRGAAGIGILRERGRMRPVAVNADHCMKSVHLARVGSLEQPGADQRSKVPLPELGFGQFRLHGEPLILEWRDLSLAI